MQSSITLLLQITISTIMGCLRCFFPDSDTSMATFWVVQWVQLTCASRVPDRS
jgi:hypothetical protein